MDNPWHLYLMAGMYIIAGGMHFIFPKAYMRIMPDYLPSHKVFIFWSGVLEIGLGILLCINRTRNLAIYGIIFMLTLFLLVHFYMLSSKKASAGLPNWVLLLRIPTQFGLMYWAYAYLTP
ncbi:MAG: hypothetical protein AAGB24_15865 [Bacteroidota bacterium]